MTICIKQPEATSHFNPLGKDTPNQAGLISHTQNENWYPGKKRAYPVQRGPALCGVGGRVKSKLVSWYNN